jgi:SAM-dependent methyltransferase
VKPSSRQIIARACRLLLGNQRYFSLHRRLFLIRSNRRAFTTIYERNLWGAGETVSGDGSTLEFSASLREVLPRLFEELGAESLVDVGCGDFHWMKAVELNGTRYIGVDVVEPLIKRNVQLYSSETHTFVIADVTKDRIPIADIAFCRHCLFHLSNRQVNRVIRNLKNTGSKYLLATTSSLVTNNVDIWPGSFRPINLEIPPFNLPKPIRILDDPDRGSVLALWRFSDISI